MDLELGLKGNQSVASKLNDVNIVISCSVLEKSGKADMKFMWKEERFV